MTKYQVYIWKKVPFVRLLLPFIAGIILQLYLQFPINLPQLCVVIAIAIFTAFFFVNDRFRFSYGWLQGVSLQVIFLCAGAMLTFKKDIRHNANWVGNYYKDSSVLLVTLQEPLVEKAKSYKAIASIEAIIINGRWEPVKGSILLYFKKEQAPPHLDYGSQIFFTKPLQLISNSGNPGAFNYQRYCAFQDIFHQVFLKQADYFATGTSDVNGLWRWLFGVRSSVINTLRKYIKPEREAGVAEALLIGYRDDLDKDLVQAYSNTGVVHIIAISGLHLGLIYGMLAGVFKWFKPRRWIKWTKPIVILLVLWIFTLIAGAAPSILRSAVMFTCIVLGETIDRKTSIYNTLAVSAFIILFYNPYYLWDVGFQLSYAAVISIVTFMQPVYNLFYIKNKLLDNIWKLNSVTLSAQILTLPFILFHFHQFPNLFLITNFVSVPLSGFILYGELLLLVFSTIDFVAIWVGKACSLMLLAMNGFIDRMNHVPFALTDNIEVNIYQAIFLAILLVALSYWLMRKHKPSFFLSLACFLILSVLYSRNIYRRNNEQKLVVYNIPQHTAIDFIAAGKYQFIGDTALLNDPFMRNFHLKPCRTLYEALPVSSLSQMLLIYPFIQYNNKRFLVIDGPLKFKDDAPIKVDAVILSKNAKVYISELAKAFECRQFVFDASNPAWKIKMWKKDCDSLHLRHHSTAEKGAFVMDL